MTGNGIESNYKKGNQNVRIWNKKFDWWLSYTIVVAIVSQTPLYMRK